MSFLSENIKNLGVRIKQTDKKVEKRVKDTIAKTLKDQFTEDKIMSPLVDFKNILTLILNWKLIDCGCYMNLPNEEWAIKIMTNLLINHGVDPTVDDKIKEDLILAS